jgi:serine/threonine protein kinase
MIDLAREIRPKGAVYKIGKPCGQGQSSWVFRAIRTDSAGHSRQVVALKVLKSQNSVSWLRREFETLSLVNSVHCARVLAWENIDYQSKTFPALVMEWIDGINLFDFTRTHSWQPRDRSRIEPDDFTDILSAELIEEIVAQIQDGLSELDRCGLHHGDLSPSNVLIDRSGCVRLIDFATAPAEHGFFHGTPAYAAPEIWQGRPSSLKSDLFALGLIERDLLEGFHDSPASVDEARARATLVSSESAGLLAMEPQSRAMRRVRSQPERKDQLAEIVARHLERKEALRRVTAISSEVEREPSHSFTCQITRLRGVLFFMSALVLTVAVQARAPLLEPPRQSAALKIGSHHWLHIELNGRTVGYAPVEIRDLQPGKHRIRWKSSAGNGETRVTLAPGDERRLTEMDLRVSRSSKGSE